MNERLQMLLEWIDGRSLRERVLLLLTAVTISFSVWDTFLLQPLDAQEKAAMSQIQALQKQLKSSDLESAAMLKKAQIDPDKQNRELLKRLQAKQQQLSGALKDKMQAYLHPEEMPQVLEDMLSDIQGLQLESLENLPAEPMLTGQAEGSTNIPKHLKQVYRHGLVMSFQGDYLSTIKYLQGLEALHWNVIWEALEYEVLEYPTARVTITVYALSVGEGLIDV